MTDIRGSSEPPIHHKPGWEYTLHLLIARQDEPRVLLARDTTGWSLPHFHPVEHDLRAVGHIQRAVRRLGLEARVLRCLSVERSPDRRRVEAFFALEVLDQAWSPPSDTRWVDAGDLANLTVTDSDQRARVVGWLHEQGADERAASHQPWILPGWQVPAVDWLSEQLARRGDGPIQAVEQVRSWDLSHVLRVRTPQGARYLKALPPAYAPETAVTHVLASHFPDAVPDVLACDHDRGWLLLNDFGALMDDDRPDLWERAVLQIAAMQRASLPHVEKLLALGCEDQRLGALAAQAESLLTDPHVRAVLSDGEYGQLCALVPRLQSRCVELSALGLPPTLVHGDLHTGNIAQAGDRLVFFDWGDACIAHPFVALFALLDERYFPPGEAAFGHRLRDLYLAQWADHGSPEALRIAFHLADSLASLRYTLGCRRCFASLGPFWTQELARSLHSCLQALLRAG